jgi:hypothetical protein
MMMFGIPTSCVLGSAPDLTHLLERAARNTFKSLNQLAFEHGYQLMYYSLAEKTRFSRLLKILILCGAINAMRWIDRLFPGSYQLARKIWSKQRIFP